MNYTCISTRVDIKPFAAGLTHKIVLLLLPLSLAIPRIRQFDDSLSPLCYKNAVSSNLRTIPFIFDTTTKTFRRRLKKNPEEQTNNRLISWYAKWTVTGSVKLNLATTMGDFALRETERLRNPTQIKVCVLVEPKRFKATGSVNFWISRSENCFGSY